MTSSGSKSRFYLSGGFVVILVISYIILPACGKTTPLSAPYFPVQKEAQEILLMARLEGELVLDEGYLRVHDNLILWPFGYRVEVEGDDIWVVNDESNRVVKVGDRLVMGGGEISAEFASEKIGQELPEGCIGPFWLGNPIVNEEE